MKPLDHDSRIQTSCLLILTAIAIAAAMKIFSAVLIPFVLAIFLTYCLTPVIDLQQKRLKIPRPLAVLTTVLVGCAVGAAIIAGDESTDLPTGNFAASETDEPHTISNAGEQRLIILAVGG